MDQVGMKKFGAIMARTADDAKILAAIEPPPKKATESVSSISADDAICPMCGRRPDPEGLKKLAEWEMV